MPRMQKTTVVLTADVHSRAKEAAGAQRISLSVLTEQALKRELDRLDRVRSKSA